MRTLFKQLFVVLVFFSCITGYIQAQPNTTFSHEKNAQSVRNFSGRLWRMKMMTPGQGIKEGLQNLPPEDIETLIWNNADVPGDVYTDLWQAGVIDDPYFGRNSVRAQWAQRYEYWYSYQFNYNQPINDEVIELVFEGVDYSCEVWLNGHYLGKHEGAFTKFSFTVNDYIRTHDWDWRKQSNMLMVKLDPPPNVNRNNFV